MEEYSRIIILVEMLSTSYLAVFHIFSRISHFNNDSGDT